MVVALSSLAPARDRCLPVDEAFADLLPEAGLRRGHVIGCSGPAAMSLLLALAARSIVAGSWMAVVDVPMLGVEAAAEMGIPLARVVRVDVSGGMGAWAERVAAAADGFDVVVTRPPAGADRVLRKIRTRLQARGSVLLAVGPTGPGVSCDIELTTTAVAWTGLEQGSGYLMGRRATVQVAGRRAPRAVTGEFWLPGPDGTARPIVPGRSPQHDADRAVLDRAG